MTRVDLLALTPETLISLANRGLVKRAEKDLAAGSGAEVTVDGDGTVRGRFPDGTATALPPGLGLDAAECGCGAPGVCRHRIGLVLAYQRGADADTDADRSAFVDWSPGEFDDDALAAALGRPALAAARRAMGRGYTARLHRPTPDDPAPRVELPTCTVRFPVPHELGYALTDASGDLRAEVVTLAVWAFRAADAEGATGAGLDGGTTTADTPTEAGPSGRTPAPTPQHTTQVSVGARTPTAHPDEEALRTALALADDLLLDGVPQAGPVFGGALARARVALTAASAHWPAGAVAELVEQLAAYAARAGRYDPERVAHLLAELHARQRAAVLDPVGVLGTKEAPETPLRRVRLVALGCRIGGTERDRTAEIYFAHADAGLALVLRKRWDLPEDQSPTGHDLSNRRLLGTPLHALATANVVSEHTARAADRTVTISRGRIAATSITPLGTAWHDLPEPLLLKDTAAHLGATTEQPPRLIRPRVEAESVRVVETASVEPVGYDPAAQRLEALAHDPAGNEFLIRADYNPLCPAGLDALAAALADGSVTAVSGMLTRDHGRTVLDPLAVLTSTGLVVPDLAPGDGDTALTTAPRRETDPITTTLETALRALAEASHHGLRNLPGPTRTHLTDSATALRRTGLHTAAGLLDTLTAQLARDSATVAVPAWVDARIHLTTSLELHRGPA
ncbi:hypothetical protein OHT76_28030 [Streptomyces sp. NBC_00287]|uniref:hypothetical protein n=1 Tax=Streptomyces sp. NBC_00287 TaxID=2975702 RepID=UPI002E2C713C|nr:hypothetical protein [Streptomyces sp. NBC_00287]